MSYEPYGISADLRDNLRDYIRLVSDGRPALRCGSHS